MTHEEPGSSPDATGNATPESEPELETPQALAEDLLGAKSDAVVEQELTAEQMSLSRRLRQPRTIISIVLPLVLIVLFARNLPGFKLTELPGMIMAGDPVLLLVAFVVFYLGFPLRGFRWAVLLRRTIRIRIRDSTEIILISWLVNCLVPAKLGDVYRAYLLKLNSPVSLSRTFGTVFIERALDLIAIAVLGLAAGFVSFRTGLPPAIQAVFLIGIGVVIGLVVGLFTLRNFGRRVLVRVPRSERFLDLYDRFEEGVFGAIGIRTVPILIIVTGLIWATEGFRLFFVVEALGFPDVHIGISGIFFVALTGSLLTAVPFTPAGIGIVEAGVVGLLTVVYNVPPNEALAIALVDRAISVLSIIVFGGIAYVFSPLRRGAGITPLPPHADPA